MIERRETIEDILNRIANDAQRLTRMTSRSAEYAALAGESSNEVYRIVRARLGAAVMPVCRDLKALAHHQHDWNGDDYCNVCGADGRA